MFAREVAFATAQIRRAPHNDSAWAYLRGLPAMPGQAAQLAYEPGISDVCLEVSNSVATVRPAEPAPCGHDWRCCISAVVTVTCEQEGGLGCTHGLHANPVQPLVQCPRSSTASRPATLLGSTPSKHYILHCRCCLGTTRRAPPRWRCWRTCTRRRRTRRARRATRAQPRPRAPWPRAASGTCWWRTRCAAPTGGTAWRSWAPAPRTAESPRSPSCAALCQSWSRTRCAAHTGGTAWRSRVPVRRAPQSRPYEP